MPQSGSIGGQADRGTQLGSIGSEIDDQVVEVALFEGTVSLILHPSVSSQRDEYADHHD
jgi:hypothetical protein